MGEIGEGKYGLSTAYYLYNGNDRNDCICSIRSNGSGRSCNGYFWSDRTGGDNGSRRRCSSRCDIRNCSTGNVSETNLYHCSHIYLLYRVSDTLFKKEFLQGHNRETYDKIMLVMDSIGLGIFTVVGVNTGISHGYVDYMFLLVFLGTITGVGGGLLRDIMAGVPPYILVRHIYACASIVGAIVCVVLYRNFGAVVSMVGASAVVILVRYLAAHYRWNLPKLTREE